MPEAKLYALDTSHPAHAARLMLEHKRIPYEWKVVVFGPHPIQLRALGFREGTVPALDIEGRKIQRSVRISRELERIKPDPPLFPADPEQRRRVAEAEEWGERELQDYSRAILRWAAATQLPVRRVGAERLGFPVPPVSAWLTYPIAWQAAYSRGANGERVREVLRRLPGALDRVDGWIAEGLIGADVPNAATFQLATSVRAFTTFEQLWPAIRERPAGRMALELVPRWTPPLPVAIPRDWLPDAPPQTVGDVLASG